MTSPDLLRILGSSVSLATTVLYLRRRDKKEQQKRAMEERLNQVIRGAA